MLFGMAKAMHLRTALDPARIRELDAALEAKAFEALTVRLVQELREQ